MKVAWMGALRRLLVVMASACLCGVAQSPAGAGAAAVKPGASADALALLDRVAKHYADAVDLHFEATEVNLTDSPLYTSKQTETASVWIGPGGAFRYEGTSWTGQGEVVSDGQKEWHAKWGYREYTETAAGAFFKGRNPIQGDDGAMYTGYNMLFLLRNLGGGLNAAHRLPDETVEVGGRTIPCHVIQYGAEDNTRKYPYSKYTDTVWIDPVALQVVRMETMSSGTSVDGSGKPPPFAVGLPRRSVTTFTVQVFGEPAPEGTFAYTPPEGWKEIAAFPSAYPKAATMAGTVTGAVAVGGGTAQKSLVGQTLPAVRVRAASGEYVSLESLVGRPLLLDLWATWCGPCMAQMQALDRVQKALAATDLRIVGLDEDRNQADSVAYLKRKGYGWEDYHATTALIKAFPSTVIPLTVLVDASGKIVYLHSGDDDDRGLLDAIAALGPAYAAVKAIR